MTTVTDRLLGGRERHYITLPIHSSIDTSRFIVTNLLFFLPQSLFLVKKTVKRCINKNDKDLDLFP